MDTSSLLRLAESRHDLYAQWQFFWFSVHYISGLCAITAGGLATAAAADGSPNWIRRNIWVWGVIASLLSGVVTFLEPQQKAQVYKRAYYDLAQEISSYKDGISNAAALHETIVRSQNIVVTGQFTTDRKNDGFVTE